MYIIDESMRTLDKNSVVYMVVSEEMVVSEGVLRKGDGVGKTKRH